MAVASTVKLSLEFTVNKVNEMNNEQCYVQ